MELNSLVFPAPTPSYTHESLKGKLIYVPKFLKYPKQHFKVRNHKTPKCKPSCSEPQRMKDGPELKKPF